MEAWHLTWQDPAAWALAAIGIALATWLRRRLRGHGAAAGCAGCGAAATTSGEHVPTEALRIASNR